MDVLSAAFISLFLFHWTAGLSNELNPRFRRSADLDVTESTETELENLDFIVPIKRKSVGPKSTSVDFCTGMMLNSTTVLTTASCVKSVDINTLEINLQYTDKDEAAAFNVERVNVIDGLEDRATSEADRKSYNLSHLALITMNRSADEADSITSAMTQGLVDLDPQVLMGGLTCKSAGFNNASYLITNDVTVVDWEKCRDYYKLNTTNDGDLLCVSANEPATPCFDNAGSILVCQGKVVGLQEVVSSGEDCSSKPYVFVKLIGGGVGENMRILPEEKSPVVVQTRSIEETDGSNVTELVSSEKATDLSSSETQRREAVSTTVLSNGTKGPQESEANISGIEPRSVNASASNSTIPPNSTSADQPEKGIKPKDTIAESNLEPESKSTATLANDMGQMNQSINILNPNKMAAKPFGHTARDERGCAKSSSPTLTVSIHPFTAMLLSYLFMTAIFTPPSFN